MSDFENDPEYIARQEQFEMQVRSIFVPRNWSNNWQMVDGQAMEIETCRRSPRFIGKVNGRYVEE